MSEDEQRIAIAEACGKGKWQFIPIATMTLGGRCEVGIEILDPAGRSWFQTKNGSTTVHDPKFFYAPDYLHDLNAMHDAILTLDAPQSRRFIDELQAIVEQQPPRFEGRWVMFHMIVASAAQRAEAFLRTVGKWKD